MKTAGDCTCWWIVEPIRVPEGVCQWEGRRFYELSLAALEPFCEKCIVVTRPELVERFPDGLHLRQISRSLQDLVRLREFCREWRNLQADRYIVLPM